MPVPLDWSDLGGEQWLLEDVLGDGSYVREGAELVSAGLFMDLPAWGYNVFSVGRSA